MVQFADLVSHVDVSPYNDTTHMSPAHTEYGQMLSIWEKGH